MVEHGELGRPGWFARLYDRVVLGHPVLVVILIVAAVGFLTYYLRNFTIDASSDSIVLENDADLKYYTYTRDVFGSDDYVFLTITPKEDLFSEETLAEIDEMSAQFEALPMIKSVMSVLTVPLFHSPKVPLLQLAQGYKTLNGDADRELAREEILSSPLYRDLLVSEDGKSTNLQINFEGAPGVANEHYQTRERLRLKRIDMPLTDAEKAELEAATQAYDEYRKSAIVERRETIEAIRAIMVEHQDIGDLYLGGVPMIMVDIINYVRDDIVTFGIGIVFLIMAMLAILFRNVKWVVLTTLTCVFTVFMMLGYLGYVDWWTTIVTSNFTSLLLVMTLAMVIHIVVRYREIYAGNPQGNQRTMLLETLRHMATPCLYMALTTMVGFASLVVSGIRPVMDFGIMMTMGLMVGYFMCFVFFPAGMMLFPLRKAPPAKFADLRSSPMSIAARIVERYRKTVGISAFVLFALCLVGASRLTVENRFIDYFKPDTPIYEGMTVIDERLGGTTPLEVVIEGEGKNYWLEPANLAKVRVVHQWLEDLPETGKVISVDTFVRILEKINDGKPVTRPLIGMAVNAIPAELKAEVLKPYVNDDFSEVRIAMRVMESSHSLNRKDLLARIDGYFDSDESPRARGVGPRDWTIRPVQQLAPKLVGIPDSDHRNGDRRHLAHVRRAVPQFQNGNYRNHPQYLASRLGTWRTRLDGYPARHHDDHDRRNNPRNRSRRHHPLHSQVQGGISEGQELRRCDVSMPQ